MRYSDMQKKIGYYPYPACLTGIELHIVRFGLILWLHDPIVFLELSAPQVFFAWSSKQVFLTAICVTVTVWCSKQWSIYQARGCFLLILSSMFLEWSPEQPERIAPQEPYKTP